MYHERGIVGDCVVPMRIERYKEYICSVDCLASLEYGLVVLTENRRAYSELRATFVRIDDTNAEARLALLRRIISEMGQKFGRLPDTRAELTEEKHRILHWSAEVLARVDDNIANEDTFLIDYDDERINEKVDRWIENQRDKWEASMSTFPQEYSKNIFKTELKRMGDEIKMKMRKDYRRAYARMKKFTKRVDVLGIKERKLHAEIQRLEAMDENDVKSFVAKFGPLRKRVFQNLRKGEKMAFEEKKLKAAFTRKVYDIDHKYMEECAKRIDVFVKDFEKSAEKSK